MAKEIDMRQDDQNLRDIARFRMIDDTFMSAVFDRQLPETEHLLKTILERDDITVVSSKAQYFLTNVYGHEVRLDVIAIDHAGTAYNVEVQRLLSGASVQRARFYAAMVDMTLLSKGKPYETMPERYTILITEDDNYQKGCPVYHIENKITELDNMPANDGGHIIYVNGQYRDTNTPIGALLHDFFCADAEEMITPILRERVHYLKETEGGRQEMCQIMENRLMEDLIARTKREIRRGEISLEQIAKIFDLPLSLVIDIAKNMGAYRDPYDPVSQPS